jgi:hypothetical protein
MPSRSAQPSAGSAKGWPQRHRQPDGQQRLRDDHQPHHAEDDGVEWRRHVEVARGSAPRLAADQHQLDDERGGRAGSDDAPHAPPLRQEGEDPGQRERVDRGRHGELQRLEPGRGARDDPRVEEQAEAERHGQRGQEQAGADEDGIGAPQAGQGRHEQGSSDAGLRRDVANVNITLSRDVDGVNT